MTKYYTTTSISKSRSAFFVTVIALCWITTIVGMVSILFLGDWHHTSNIFNDFIAPAVSFYGSVVLSYLSVVSTEYLAVPTMNEEEFGRWLKQFARYTICKRFAYISLILCLNTTVYFNEYQIVLFIGICAWSTSLLLYRKKESRSWKIEHHLCVDKNTEQGLEPGECSHDIITNDGILTNVSSGLFSRLKKGDEFVVVKSTKNKIRIVCSFLKNKD